MTSKEERREPPAPWALARQGGRIGRPLRAAVQPAPPYAHYVSAKARNALDDYKDAIGSRRGAIA